MEISKLLYALLLIFLLTGSNSINFQDLSGEIELVPKDNGMNYTQRIYSYSQPDFLSDLITSLVTHNNKPSFDYVRLSDVFSRLEFNKQFIISQNTYILKVQFIKIPPSQSDYSVKIFNSLGDEIPSNIIQKNIDNDNVVDGFDSNDWYHRLSGYCLLSFIDSVSKTEFLLKTEYKIDFSPIHQSYDNKTMIPARVELSTEANICNQYVLHGEKTIKPKMTLKVDVIDSNLDGIFNDNDKILFDQLHSTIFNSGYPFNKKVVVNKYKYIMSLKPVNDNGEKYILTIEKSN